VALKVVKKVGKPELAYGIVIDDYSLEPHHQWYLDQPKGKSG
jgi:hypothetical protein